MKKEQIEKVKAIIRDVENFPSQGILFRDLTTAFKDGEALHIISDELRDMYQNLGVTKVVGIEARGFVGASILAYELNAGFVPLRKPGKLPANTIQKSYAKEYGVDTIEIHADAIDENDIVVIHDDVLATGGTMAAAYDLVLSRNPKKIYINFIIELSSLKGRDLFPADVDIESLIIY